MTAGAIIGGLIGLLILWKLIVRPVLVISIRSFGAIAETRRERRELRSRELDEEGWE